MLYNYDKEYLLNTARKLLTDRKSGISTNDFASRILRMCGLVFPGFGSDEYYDYKEVKSTLLVDLKSDERFICVKGKWYLRDLYEQNIYVVEERPLYLDSARDDEKVPSQPITSNFEE